MSIVATVTDGVIDSSNYKAEEVKAVGGDMDYDSFLQLLCAEMQYQDPLEPTSNTEYVAQLATFSQLEATLSMSDTMANSLSATQSNTANNLVGKYVLVKDSQSSTGFASGIVDYVTFEDGNIKISVGDKLYPVEDVDTIATDEYYEAIVTAQTFGNMLSSLPSAEEITTAHKTAIQQLREMYDGMSEYQKGFISESDLRKLKVYEDKIAELESASSEEETTTDESGEQTTETTEGSQSVTEGEVV
ncbi:MAG: flagellar hook capping FlgD N-terminal domain-containing protein [Agathobacter sp.]|nr:flagellar hook capping FlgD N-terminal domain-containing protein [Agathobacter sp.]